MSAPPLSEPVGGERGKLKLAEVVAQVAEQEKRYSDLEVDVRVTYTATAPTIRVGNIVTDYTHEEHSILRGRSAYRSMRNEFMTLGGKRSEQFQVRASDGKWTLLARPIDTGWHGSSAQRVSE